MKLYLIIAGGQWWADAGPLQFKLGFIGYVFGEGSFHVCIRCYDGHCEITRKLCATVGYGFSVSMYFYEMSLEESFTKCKAFAPISL